MRIRSTRRLTLHRLAVAGTASIAVLQCYPAPASAAVAEPYRKLPAAVERGANASSQIAMNVARGWESANYPGRYVRHRFTLAEITPVVSALDHADATWIAVPALNGAPGAVSLRSSNYPNTFLRHQGFRLKQHANDGSDLFKADASFFIRPGLNGASGTFSFEASNVSGYFVRHRNAQLWLDNRTGANALFPGDASFRQTQSFRRDREVSIEASNVSGQFLRHRNTLGDLTAVNPASNLDRADATWVVRPALNGASGAVSFESKNYPGTYLRHQGYRLKQHLDDGSDSNLFRQDASFYERRGLAGGSTKSYEAVNVPGHFIRHQNFQFWVARNDGSDLFRRDASFVERSPQFVKPGECTAFFRRWRGGYDNDQLMEVCGWVMGVNQYCATRGARPMVSWDGNRRYLACQPNWKESTYFEEFEQLAVATAAQFADAAVAAAPFVKMGLSGIACAKGVIFACATLALDVAELAGAQPPGIAREALDAADEVGKCVDGNVVACAQLGARGARAAGVKIPGEDADKVAENGEKCVSDDFAACVALGLMAADAAGIPVGLGRGDVADALDCANGDNHACLSLGQRAVQAGTGIPLGGIVNGADSARKCAVGDNDACISLGKELAAAA